MALVLSSVSYALRRWIVHQMCLDLIVHLYLCKDQGQLSFLGNFSFNDEDESAEKENLLLQTFKDDLLVFCVSWMGFAWNVDDGKIKDAAASAL